MKSFIEFLREESKPKSPLFVTPDDQEWGQANRNAGWMGDVYSGDHTTNYWSLNNTKGGFLMGPGEDDSRIETEKRLNSDLGLRFDYNKSEPGGLVGNQAGFKAAAVRTASGVNFPTALPALNSTEKVSEYRNNIINAVKETPGVIYNSIKNVIAPDDYTKQQQQSNKNIAQQAETNKIKSDEDQRLRKINNQRSSSGMLPTTEI